MHLLWTFLYCKTYTKWAVMKRMTSGTDPKTLRKWISLFLDANEDLEGHIVSVAVFLLLLVCCCLLALPLVVSLTKFQIIWTNWFKGDINNDCLVSVDSLDFQIPWLGTKFKSHKLKFSGGLCYEVAVSIIGGDCVWINGPYEPGIWKDITIFHNGLLSMLDLGERVEADDGY